MRMPKTFKAILVALCMGIVITVSSWTFAQGAGVSGSIKDLSNNQGVQGVIITIKDVSAGKLVGTGKTDVLGNYSVSIPAPGNYTLEASRFGYDSVTAPDVIELSDMTP
ncbi:MAG: Carboxypeptidase regulatory-like domain, partial [Acidobacteria bacterium]|nr:Carboxypeptidase regulatory-like domain [Acidobacteriota bacterium]